MRLIHAHRGSTVIRKPSIIRNVELWFKDIVQHLYHPFHIPLGIGLGNPLVNLSQRPAIAFFDGQLRPEYKINHPDLSLIDIVVVCFIGIRGAVMFGLFNLYGINLFPIIYRKRSSNSHGRVYIGRNFPCSLLVGIYLFLLNCAVRSNVVL